MSSLCRVAAKKAIFESFFAQSIKQELESNDLLSMNSQKSYWIVFRQGERTCKLNVCGIKEKKTLKFLGVTFDANYSFQNHFNIVRRTINWKISKLKPICKYLSRSTREETITALCYGNLTYCYQIYGRLPGIRAQA